MRSGAWSSRYAVRATRSRFDGGPQRLEIGRERCRERHACAGARVLDCGAGTGIATRLLRARGARVVSLDPGAGMAAQLHAAEPGARLYRTGDLGRYRGRARRHETVLVHHRS